MGSNLGEINMSTWKSIYQQVTVSPDNSSIINLAASASFTGTGVDISNLGVNSIQVALKADQNCIVIVQQSPDSTNWDLSDTFEYLSSPGGNSWTIQAIASWVRVVVTNIGSSTTTFFRLQTTFLPISSALPRSLDSVGNLKVGVNAFKDHSGFQAEVSPAGQLRVTELYRLVGTLFQGTTLDTSFWTSTLANGGTVTLLGSEARLRTNTTLNGSAILQSVRTARFTAGASPNFYRGIIQMDSPLASNTRRWGAFNATSGTFFELSGTTFRLVTRKASVDTAVANGSFNGDIGSTFTPTFTNVNYFEIYWTPAQVWFVINEELIHTMTANSTAWTDDLNLPSRIENTNGAITTDSSVYVRTATISRLGPLMTRPIWRNFVGAVGATILKRSAGVLHRVTYNHGANGTVCSLYDALTATNPIAVVETESNNVPNYIEFDLDFYTGLTVVTTGAASNFTVIYE
jgi:hypothetical protein